MELMLDTNICIYLIKGHPRSVLERFAAHAVGTIGISIVTLAELEYGLSKSSRPAKNREASGTRMGTSAELTRWENQMRARL